MRILKDFFLLWKRVYSQKEKSISLQLRLFLFLTLFVIALVAVFLLLMMAFGVFNRGAKESQVWVENEISHISQRVEDDFGKLSVQGVTLSEQISDKIEQKDIFSYTPQELEALLSNQMPLLLSALKNNQCSGAFFILDSTQDDHWGVFLKRTEPNAIGIIGSKIHYLRGPAQIARDNSVELLGQWAMLFSKDELNFFEEMKKTTQKNQQFPLSRLYQWSKRFTLNGNSEAGILLCVPVLAPDGSFLGVCGMEVSSMLFKLQYSPDNSRFSGIFSSLCPTNEQELYLNDGLVAGNTYLTSSTPDMVTARANADNSLLTYRNQEAMVYRGMQLPMKLYPQDSPYAKSKWSIAVLMPDKDFNVASSAGNAPFYLALMGLLVFSFLFALIISNRYIRPVVVALDLVKNKNHREIVKVGIAEIDDLFAYLAKQDEEKEKLQQLLQNKDKPSQAETDNDKPNLVAYREFVHNIQTLSPAEMSVFNLYMKGNTAKEIASILYLSMNTIKTHNKRIYSKLNVTSRKELMVFVQMMSKEESEDNIFN